MSAFKERSHNIIFGTETVGGRVFDIALLVLILASITILMLESVQEINDQWGAIFKNLEWIITGLFTVEYCFRIWTTEKKLKYVLSFYGIIDLFSILPTYLSFFITGSHALATIRVLRLLRAFRVLKLVRFTGEVTRLRAAMKTSSRKIFVFLYFVIILSVFVGTLMYIVEGRENGFTSIPRSIYWAIVTLTTVGYGDIAPQTPLGQLLAMVLMITGYGVIAVPTGLVTAEIVRADYQKIESQAKGQKGCLQCGHVEIAVDAKYCKQCGHSFKEQQR